LREYHLYVIPLSRHPNVLISGDRQAMARAITKLFAECSTQESPKWRARFTVEVFRSLSAISPEAIIDDLASAVGEVEDLELTPVLEAVCEAARNFPRERLVRSPGLSHAIRSTWKQQATDRGTEVIGNRPGIMGRLLELLGRLGEAPLELIQGLEGHPLKERALHQFVFRPIEFLDPKQRLSVYWEALLGTSDPYAFRQIISEVVLKDNDPEVRETVRRRLRLPQAPDS
jgi:hypothetical protein